MARIVFLLIAFYLAYRLVFDLIVPVIRTTRSMRRQFSKMRDQSNNAGQNNAGKDNNHASRQSKSKVGEYIDFEETE
jgi:hypothetical protein